VLSRFEKELPAQQFNTGSGRSNWTPRRHHPGSCVYSLRTALCCSWVKERFVASHRDDGAEFFSSPIRVSLTLETADAPEPIKTSAPAIPRRAHSRTRISARRAFEPHSRIQLRRLCRRKKPITGAPAALQVAEHPGHRTTRSSSTVAWLGKDPPDSRGRQPCSRAASECSVRYSTPRSTISDVIRAYQQKSFDEFKRYYHSLDLLLIETSSSHGKDRTKRSFFTHFNALIEAHKLIIPATHIRKIFGNGRAPPSHAFRGA